MTVQCTKAAPFIPAVTRGDVVRWAHPVIPTLPTSRHHTAEVVSAAGMTGDGPWLSVPTSFMAAKPNAASASTSLRPVCGRSTRSLTADSHHHHLLNIHLTSSGNAQLEMTPPYRVESTQAGKVRSDDGDSSLLELLYCLGRLDVPTRQVWTRTRHGDCRASVLCEVLLELIQLRGFM